MERNGPGTISDRDDVGPVVAVTSTGVDRAGHAAQTAALRAACRSLRKLGGHSAARTGWILGLTADRVRELCKETVDEARQRARGTR